MCKKKSKLGNWGFVLTAIYFAVILIVICFTDLVNTGPLTMNELGDFLAGIFGPPALVWVVISFYLQSAELQNSVNALNLQAEELAKSVEQQIAMVELTRESITHEKTKLDIDEKSRKAALQPNFKVDLEQYPSVVSLSSNSSKPREKHIMAIENIGAMVNNVKIEMGDYLEQLKSIDSPKTWDRKEQLKIGIKTIEGNPVRPIYDIKFTFTNSDGIEGEQVVSITIS